MEPGGSSGFPAPRALDASGIRLGQYCRRERNGCASVMGSPLRLGVGPRGFRFRKAFSRLGNIALRCRCGCRHPFPAGERLPAGRQRVIKLTRYPRAVQVIEHRCQRCAALIAARARIWAGSVDAILTRAAVALALPYHELAWTQLRARHLERRSDGLAAGTPARPLRGAFSERIAVYQFAQDGHEERAPRTARSSPVGGHRE